MAESLFQTGYGVNLAQSNSSATAPGWDSSLADQGVTYNSPSQSFPTLPSWLQGINSTGIGNTFLNMESYLGTENGSPQFNITPSGIGIPTNVSSILNPSGGQSSSFWSDLFLRSAVIILGYICTAVGLTMFKNSK